MTQTHSAVSAHKVYKTFGSGDAAVTALAGISVDFPAGEFTAIMGPSGSGKSTLMHVLATLDTADAHAETSIRIDGVELHGLKDAATTAFRRDHVGFIFQAFNLIPTLTAEQNILLPLGIAGKKVDERWYQDLVRKLGLESRLKHKPSELSGGQQQRVAIARALLARPSVIFADEPTGNLDTTSGAEVLKLIREACDQLGQTVLMVTHDPVAASYADRVLVLKDGQIVDEIRQPSRETVLDALAKAGA